MPVSASYTEGTLAAFMVTELSDIGTALGWSTTTDQLFEAVNDALYGYFGTSVQPIANASNMPKLRALARVAAWKAAIKALASRYQFSTDGQSFQRQQMQDMAKNALAEAEREAAAYGLPEYSATIDKVSRPHDPYTWVPYGDRTIP